MTGFNCGDIVVCVDLFAADNSRISKYLTLDKKYVVTQNSDESGTIGGKPRIEVCNDIGDYTFFYCYRFISLAEYRARSINNILS